MLEYNVHDVEITELVYLKLRPWMKSHPNMGVYNVDKPLSCSFVDHMNLSQRKNVSILTLENLQSTDVKTVEQCHVVEQTTLQKKIGSIY